MHAKHGGIFKALHALFGPFVTMGVSEMYQSIKGREREAALVTAAKGKVPKIQLDKIGGIKGI